MITSLAALFRELSKPVEREWVAGAVIFRDGDPARYELGLTHETFYRRLTVLEKKGLLRRDREQIVLLFPRSGSGRM